MVQFPDNEYLSNLESLIIQLNNAEAKHSKFSILINPQTDESIKQRMNEITEALEVEVLVADYKAFHKSDLDPMLENLL